MGPASRVTLTNWRKGLPYTRLALNLLCSRDNLELILLPLPKGLPRASVQLTRSSSLGAEDGIQDLMDVKQAPSQLSQSTREMEAGGSEVQGHPVLETTNKPNQRSDAPWQAHRSSTRHLLTRFSISRLRSPSGFLPSFTFG